MKIWKTSFRGNTIRVENSWLHGEQLFVNEKLQDKRQSVFGNARLWGHIKTEEGERLTLKVSIFSSLRTRCFIFLDDEKILEG